MATILTANGNKTVGIQSTSGAVGRWCKPPQVPDQCFHCFDPYTLSHPPAVVFYEERGMRYGMCADCQQHRERSIRWSKSK